MAILYELLICILAILLLYIYYKNKSSDKKGSERKSPERKTDTSIDAEYDADGRPLHKTEEKKSEKGKRLEKIEKEYTYDDPDFKLEKITPSEKMKGRVLNIHGDAIYGAEDRYRKDKYYGRLSHKAKVELLDRRVYKNQFELDIIKVLVIENEWKEEVGKIGWISLQDTSFSADYDEKKRVIKE